MAFTAEERADSRKGYLGVFARLAPGVSQAQAQTEMSQIAKRLETELEENKENGVRIASLTDTTVGSYRSRLFILLGAVAFVLLIACVNVANLLLARGAARGKEMAIRAALGAGRSRVLRQLFTGEPRACRRRRSDRARAGVLGRAFPQGDGAERGAATRSGRAGPDDRGIRVRRDAREQHRIRDRAGVAHRASGSAGDACVKADAAPGGSARDGVRQLLVAAEVSLSLMLLVGAGLLIRSGILLQRVEPGFVTSRVFTAWVALPPAQYESVESVRRAYDRILTEVRAVPGVQSAAAITVLPMTGLNALASFVPEGRADDPSNSISFNFRLATPGVFRTFGIPIRQGRDFDDRDIASAPCALIVNEAGARRAWPNESAIGKGIPGPRDSTGTRSMCRVVGVVGDAHDDGLREAVRPQIYFAAAQAPAAFWFAMQRSAFIVARTVGDPGAMAKPLQAAVARVDATLPLFNIRSMDERMCGDARHRPLQYAAPHGARCHRPRARGGRDLWCRGVFRHATHQRDRPPNGARRDTRTRSAARCGAGDASSAARHWCGSRRWRSWRAACSRVSSSESARGIP